MEEYRIEEIDFGKILSQAKRKTCLRYGMIFSDKIKEAEDEEDESRIELFRTLAMATSFHFNSESNHEPFVAKFSSESGRTAMPVDFTDEQLDLISELSNHLEDAELLSRLGDILWVRRRDFEAVRLAIKNYMKSASNLKQSDTHQAIDRLERAIHLAVSLGKGAMDLTDEVVQEIEELIDFLVDEDDFHKLKLIKLLRRFGKGDSKKYVLVTEKLALNAEEGQDWYQARSMWEENAKLHQSEGNAEKERNALVNAAETYVKEADSANSKMLESSFLQQAINAYRKVGGFQEKTAELHSRLLESQEGIANEMGSFSHEIDNSKLIDHTLQNVENKTLKEAIFAFCILLKPINKQALEERTKKLLKDHPFQFIVSGMIVDEEGKTVTHYPDMLSGTEEEKAQALEAHMHNQAQHNLLATVHGIVEPARRRILLEHEIRESTFRQVVQSSPLVPPGREYLFSKGLYQGFIGDFVSATNTLVTQFEHSVRFILKNHGVVTSGIDDQNRQDDRSLNTTLEVEELEGILGEDIVFNLKNILISKFGGNLRNKVAHGLMWPNSYYNAYAMFFWGFMLRLIFWPIIVDHYQKKEKGAVDENEKD